MNKPVMDVKDFVAELAEGMTIQELEEWNRRNHTTCKEKGKDPNGFTITIIRDIIFTTIKAKQERGEPIDSLEGNERGMKMRLKMQEIADRVVGGGPDGPQ